MNKHVAKYGGDSSESQLFAMLLEAEDKQQEDSKTETNPSGDTFASKAWQFIKDMFSKFWDWLKDMYSKIKEKLKQFATWIGLAGVFGLETKVEVENKEPKKEEEKPEEKKEEEKKEEEKPETKQDIPKQDTQPTDKGESAPEPTQDGKPEGKVESFYYDTINQVLTEGRANKVKYSKFKMALKSYSQLIYFANTYNPEPFLNIINGLNKFITDFANGKGVTNIALTINNAAFSRHRDFYFNAKNDVGKHVEEVNNSVKQLSDNLKNRGGHVSTVGAILNLYKQAQTKLDSIVLALDKLNNVVNGQNLDTSNKDYKNSINHIRTTLTKIKNPVTEWVTMLNTSIGNIRGAQDDGKVKMESSFINQRSATASFYMVESIKRKEAFKELFLM